jgi:hypothetical protein
VVLHSVPHPVFDLQPQQVIQGRYRAASTKEDALDDFAVTAQCQFHTRMPTIHLMQFQGMIQSFQCDGNYIRLTMRTLGDGKRVETVWSNVLRGKKLALLMDFQTAKQCLRFMPVGTQANATMARQVLAVHLELHDRVLLRTVDLHPDQLIESYELEVNQGRPGVRKNATQSAGKEENVQEEWQEKKLDGTHIPLNINHDMVGGRASRELPLVRTHVADITCDNCWSHGEVLLRMKLRGSIFKLASYDIEFAGRLRLHLQMIVTIHAAHRQVALRKSLLKLGMYLITLPGVFELGPQLALDAGISYDVRAPRTGFEVTAGAFVDIPVHWYIKGEESKPQFSIPPGRNGVPTVVPIAPRVSQRVAEELNASITMSLVPNIGIGIQFLNFFHFNVAIEEESEIGFRFLGRDKVKCGSDPAKPMSVQMVHNHHIAIAGNAVFLTKRLPLWEAGEKPVQCRVCQVCFPPLSTKDTVIEW